MIFSITDETFGPVVLGSTKPVLVDVWAPWCEPCLMLDGELTRLDNKYGEKIFIAKINFDKNSRMAAGMAAANITSIPALMYYPVGVQSPRVLLGCYPMERIAKAFGFDKLR